MSRGPYDETAVHHLELLWAANLCRARKRYLKAATEFHRELMNGASPESRKTSGLRRREAQAFAEYCRVLATFMELVELGKVPTSQDRR